jgi:hypothetical protein
MILLLAIACQPDTTLVKTDPPSAPVVSIQPTSPLTADDLVVSIDVAAEDPAGAEVGYTYAWTRDGAPSVTTESVDAGETSRGETWAVVVTAVANDRVGGSGTASVVIGDTPGIVEGVTLHPDPAWTDTVLTADAVGSDPDGDDVSFTWAWYVDGVATGPDAPTLDGATYFSRDQEVTVQVGVVGSPEAPLESAPLRISDTAPTAPGVTIDPTEPAEAESLLCGVAVPSTDLDEDTVAYTVAWTVDGAAFTDATTATLSGDTIPTRVTNEGEVWTCSVTPDDGTLVGPWGTASVTIGPSLSACPGDGNCALRFNGTNSYVTVPDDATLDGGGAALTVEAWVWYDSVTSNCMTTVRKGTSASAVYDYWLHKNYSPGDSLFWGSYPGWTTLAFSAVTSGAWYHYAGVYDPGAAEARMYVNGILVGSGSAAPGVANSEELRIGIDWDFGCQTLGVIDEVRISRAVRYSADFAPVTQFTADSDTMALWHFDENVGTIAYDASGNGNDGTIVNATWTTEHP